MNKEFFSRSFEETPSSDQDLSFNEAKKYFTDRDINFDKEMVSLGLVDSESGLYTNLALILSDQNPYSIKLAIFSDSSKTRVLKRKEFEGSILKQIDDVLEFISTNKDLLNLDKSGFPKATIREAVLNSVVHRDYSFLGPTLVKVNQEAFEITSFGTLFDGLSIDDLKAGIHLCRNPKLSNIFNRLGLTEALGTGIALIFDEYSKARKQPQINLTTNLFQLVLPSKKLDKKILVSKPKLNEVDINKEKTGKTAISNHLTSNQKKILLALKDSKIYDAKAIIKTTKIKKSTFYKAVKGLQREGLVSSDINGSKKIYQATNKGSEVLTHIE